MNHLLRGNCDTLEITIHLQKKECQVSSDYNTKLLIKSFTQRSQPLPSTAVLEFSKRGLQPQEDTQGSGERSPTQNLVGSDPRPEKRNPWRAGRVSLGQPGRLLLKAATCQSLLCGPWPRFPGGQGLCQPFHSIFHLPFQMHLYQTRFAPC